MSVLAGRWPTSAVTRRARPSPRTGGMWLPSITSAHCPSACVSGVPQLAYKAPALCSRRRAMMARGAKPRVPVRMGAPREVTVCTSTPKRVGSPETGG
jgi:hypothetical protein